MTSSLRIPCHRTQRRSVQKVCWPSTEIIGDLNNLYPDEPRKKKFRCLASRAYGGAVDDNFTMLIGSCGCRGSLM